MTSAAIAAVACPACKLGDRVRASQEGLKVLFGRRYEGRLGTVVGFGRPPRPRPNRVYPPGRAAARCVRVAWDDLKERQSLHPDFLEVVP